MRLLHCNKSKDTAYFRLFIGKDNYNYNPFSFRLFIRKVVESRVLINRDTLLVYNVAIHTRRDNNDLTEYSWNNFWIQLLRLLIYSPKLNPIKMI